MPEIVDEAFRGSDVFVSEIALTEETSKAIAAESIRSGSETLAMILPPDVRERARSFRAATRLHPRGVSPLEIYTFAIQLPLLEYVKSSPPMDALLHSRAVAAEGGERRWKRRRNSSPCSSHSRARSNRALEGNWMIWKKTRPEEAALRRRSKSSCRRTFPAIPRSWTPISSARCERDRRCKRLLHDLLDDRNVRLATRMDAGLREKIRSARCSTRSARDT